MITILFTDTHFGTKQNSMTWFKSQTSFITDQFIPMIKQLKTNNQIRLIHLGDVFDSRSTISTYIATEVVKLFTELRSYVDEFIIIGGNHDYYSPNTDRIDTLNLLLKNTNIQLVTQNYLIKDQNLYLPWYEWYKYIESNTLKDLVDKYNIKNIFTHADLVMNPPKNLPTAKIFSGHIHTPKFMKNIYNIGSCYPLDFGDVNSLRGVYILDGEDIKFIANNKSINFWRLYDEEIFNDSNSYKSSDYFELYITQENLQNQRYIDKLSEYIKTYKNTIIIPQYPQLSESVNKDISNYNIEDMIKDFIPEQLTDKFNTILQQYELRNGKEL